MCWGRGGHLVLHINPLLLVTLCSGPLSWHHPHFPARTLVGFRSQAVSGLGGSLRPALTPGPQNKVGVTEGDVCWASRICGWFHFCALVLKPQLCPQEGGLEQTRSHCGWMVGVTNGQCAQITPGLKADPTGRVDAARSSQAPRRRRRRPAVRPRALPQPRFQAAECQWQRRPRTRSRRRPHLAPHPGGCPVQARPPRGGATPGPGAQGPFGSAPGPEGRRGCGSALWSFPRPAPAQCPAQSRTAGVRGGGAELDPLPGIPLPYPGAHLAAGRRAPGQRVRARAAGALSL